MYCNPYVQEFGEAVTNNVVVAVMVVRMPQGKCAEALENGTGGRGELSMPVPVQVSVIEV